MYSLVCVALQTCTHAHKGTDVIQALTFHSAAGGRKRPSFIRNEKVVPLLGNERIKRRFQCDMKFKKKKKGAAGPWWMENNKHSESVCRCWKRTRTFIFTFYPDRMQRVFSPTNICFVFLFCTLQSFSDGREIRTLEGSVATGSSVFFPNRQPPLVLFMCLFLDEAVEQQSCRLSALKYCHHPSYWG